MAENTPTALSELGLGEPIEWGWNGGSCYVAGEAIVIGGTGSAKADRPIIEAKAKVIAAKDLMVRALMRIAAHPYRGGVSPAQARELARTVLRVAGLQAVDLSPPLAATALPINSRASSTASPNPESKLTDEQRRLLSACHAAGHGWSRYAGSIERVGRCTPGQEVTLRNMVARIEAMNRRSGRCSAGDDCDIESGRDEAASVGYQASDFH